MSIEGDFIVSGVIKIEDTGCNVYVVCESIHALPRPVESDLDGPTSHTAKNTDTVWRGSHEHLDARFGSVQV